MGKLLRRYLRELILVAVIVLVGFVIALNSDAFFTVRNLTNLLNNNAVMGIMALGIMVVIVTGNIDVSVGAQLAVVSMVVGAYVKATDGRNPLLAVLLGMLCGLALSTVNGFFVSKLNIPAIVVTLGTLNIMRGGMLLVTNGKWVENLTGPFTKFANYKICSLSVSIWIWLGVLVLTYVFLYRTRVGRDILAVGGNPQAAQRMGISQSTVFLYAFGYLGLLVGLAAAIFTSKLKIAQPSSGTGYEMQLIAAAVIGGTSFAGGRASVVGTFLGVILLGLIENGLVLLKVPIYWQTLTTGVIITAAVIFSVLQVKKGSR